MTYANKKVVMGTWLSDKLNGVAKVKKHCQDFKEYIYRDDIKINIEQ